MAELVSVSIEKMAIGLKNTNLQFSEQHHFSFDFKTKSLRYEKKEKDPFFSQKISNISLFVGKNGSGKSSILELISSPVKGRSPERNHYFSIFHIEDNMFYIEGTAQLVSSIENLSTDRGFFMVEAEDIFRPLNSKKLTQKLDLSLIKSAPKISWYSEMILPKKRKSDVIIDKKVKNVESIENVIKFIISNKNNRVDSQQINLKITHKQSYSSNSSRLLDEIYRNEKIDIHRGILPYALVKKLNRESHAPEVSFNNRRVQNHYFKRFKKEYYIVQFLEKYLLSLISFLEGLEVSREEIINIIQDDVDRYLVKYDLGFLEDDNSAREFLKRKINCLTTVVGNLREWHSRLKFFKGRTKRDSPFTDPDSLGELTEWLLEIGEVYSPGYFEGNSIRMELYKELVVEQRALDFRLLDLLMNEFSEIFSVQFENLSDGEIVYYNTFSSIFAAIKNANEAGKDCVLVLDEPDLNLHPEWCRLFINDCIDIVNNYFDTKVQFIIATHSPYMISDVPRHNVYSLEKGSGNEFQIKQAEKTFAANIIDILSDSFFLDYSIGEFARKKLETISNEEMDYIDDGILKLLIENSKKGENGDD